ncbi:MAG TPA: RDD family protein [Terriglobales bacterium]
MDKLIIDTPEQVHLEFVLAGIGSRFMAAFLDTLILGALMLLVAISEALWVARPLLGKGYDVWVDALATLLFFLVFWGYYIMFEIFWKGQTPGKRWAGIRVIKDSGRPINAFEVVARNLVRLVDYLPGFYGVGVLAMLLTSRNQRLGDLVAGTLVVHESSDREASLFFNTAPTAGLPMPQAANLTLQEAELIETFLSRRLDIPPEVRRQNGQRIAGMIGARLHIGPEGRPADNEDFLEHVVKEFRNRAKYR